MEEPVRTPRLDVAGEIGDEEGASVSVDQVLQDVVVSESRAQGIVG
jgi:hypothetical protein